MAKDIKDEDLTEIVNRRVCWEGSPSVDNETVLAIDLSDIRKSYAKKMEYLGRVGGYEALRNMYVPANAILFFVSVVIGFAFAKSPV